MPRADLLCCLYWSAQLTHSKERFVQRTGIIAIEEFDIWQASYVGAAHPRTTAAFYKRAPASTDQHTKARPLPVSTVQI